MRMVYILILLTNVWCASLFASSINSSFELTSLIPSNFEEVTFLLPREYIPKKLLGRGSYGYVCAAKFKGKDIAIKKIAHYAGDDEKKWVEKLGATLREIIILRRLKHENILAASHLVVVSSRQSTDVYIYMDFMDSDLAAYIKNHQPLKDDEIKLILSQLLKGLNYLHSAKVIHRDLTPKNILINQNMLVKIGDFGLSRLVLASDDPLLMSDYVVMRWYRAPEALRGKAYNQAIDLWAVGCIFAELLNSKVLFAGGNTQQQKELINKFSRRRAFVLDNVCRKRLLAFDLLAKFLTIKQRHRISAADALAHPYLKTIRKQASEVIFDGDLSEDFLFEKDKKVNSDKLYTLLLNQVEALLGQEPF